MKKIQVAAVLLSGGVGSRCGSDVPKQYVKDDGKMMIGRTIDALLAHPEVEALQIVAAEEWRPVILAEWKESGRGTEALLGFSAPGENRQLSILNGLRDIKEHMDAGALVIVQDAARPFTSATLLERCIRACAEHEGAMPVLPVKDTMYLSGDGGKVESLLDRDRLFAGQAPEVFRFEKYLEANEALLPDRILAIRGSTEAAFLAGMDVRMVEGEEGNFKVTAPEDMERYREKLRRMAEREGKG